MVSWILFLPGLRTASYGTPQIAPRYTQLALSHRDPVKLFPGKNAEFRATCGEPTRHHSTDALQKDERVEAMEETERDLDYGDDTAPADGPPEREILELEAYDLSRHQEPAYGHVATVERTEMVGTDRGNVSDRTACGENTRCQVGFFVVEAVMESAGLDEDIPAEHHGTAVEEMHGKSFVGHHIVVEGIPVLHVTALELHHFAGKDVDVGVASEEGQGALEGIGCGRIGVIIGTPEELTRCETGREVEGQRSDVVRHPSVDDVREPFGHHGGSAVGGSVIDDDEFDIAMRLLGVAGKAVTQHVTSIARCDQHAYPRHVVSQSRSIPQKSAYLRLQQHINSLFLRPMYGEFQHHLQSELSSIKESGLFKNERIITSPQGPEIMVEGRSTPVLNFCANNYLGLSSHPAVIQAAKDALDTHGFGMSSVRFICGTQDIHKILEEKIAAFCQTDDTILYAACFDANGGVFEPLLSELDAIVSDSLNHASIIDGVRLCKAKRYRYESCNMADLEAQLRQAKADGARTILIATDAVFSMDGTIAPLDRICDLADAFGALVMVDECHSMGFMGAHGRGVVEHCGVTGRVDIITGTLGKALGGGIGGFTTGRQEIIDMLRQRSRPYLFSNSLPPAIVGASIAVMDLLSATTELRDTLEGNTKYFREGMSALGYDIVPGTHPITPIMLYDAPLAQRLAEKLLDEGIYVIGFFYPVVPKGKARIRVQVSAAHTREHLDRAIAAFGKAGRELGVLQ